MEIPIRNKKKEIIANAIVSKEDYLHLSQFKWNKDNLNYVRTTINNKNWKLHRYIMIIILGNEIAPQQPIDHINNNPLDNTRNNLRIVTISENARNKKKIIRENATSNYIGVSKINDKKWNVSIRVDDNILYASYNNEIYAAYQYNLWVDEYNLKTANKNKIEDPKDFIKWTAKEKRGGSNLPIGIYRNIKNKFIVTIYNSNKKKYIGSFDKLEDAVLSLENAKIEKEKIEREKLLSITKEYNENGNCIIKIQETEVIIDEELYYDIIKYKWHINKYGYCIGIINGKDVRLHRYIMNYTGIDFIDHINHNKLDNTRKNLRIVTPQQNSINTSSRKGSTSKYVGVSYDNSRNKWLAMITIDRKLKNLGRFNNEIDAAKVRDAATKQYNKEYGNLNFPYEI